MKRERISLDVLPEERNAFKSYAAACGQTLREFILEALYEKMKIANETLDLNKMTSKFSASFKEVWDNKEDSAYDAL